MRKKITPYLLSAPVIVLCAILIISIINGVIQSFGIIPAFDMTKPTLAYYQEILHSESLMESIGLSLYLAVATTFLALAIGSLLCWSLILLKKKRRRAGTDIKDSDFSTSYGCSYFGHQSAFQYRTSFPDLHDHGYDGGSGMDILHPLYAGKLGRYHGISLEGNTLRMLFHCSSHGQYRRLLWRRSAKSGRR